MDSINKTGRIVGVLFLLMILLGVPGTMFRGISSSLLESEGFLNQVLANSLEMRFSVISSIVVNAVGLGVAITLYPVIRKHSPSLAIWYLVIWTVEWGVVVLGDYSHLLLISLSERFSQAANPALSNYELAGFLAGKGYIWGHLLGLIFYSSGALVFNYFLFKTRLIPRFISVWGMVAVGIVCLATWAQVLGIKVSFNLYMQNGLHMIFMTGWLLIKGFSVTNQIPRVAAV